MTTTTTTTAAAVATREKTRRIRLLEYVAQNFLADKSALCTNCKVQRAKHLTFDPIPDSVAYLCDDCFRDYCEELGKRENNKENEEKDII
jgi:hypothetical protein